MSVEYLALPWQRISVEEISNQWQEAENSWWPKSFFGRSKVRKTLVKQAGAKGKPIPAKDLKVLAELHKCGVQIEELGKKLSTIPDWCGFETDIAHFNQTLDVAKRLRTGTFAVTEDMTGFWPLRGRLESWLVRVMSFLVMKVLLADL